MGVTLNCEQCGEEFLGKRKTAKFCSDECRVYSSRNKVAEFDEKPEQEKLSELEEELGFKIDRTKAFTEEEQGKVNKLPKHKRLAAMARPNSAETMEQGGVEKHYRSSNYPEFKYHSSGGGGGGTNAPRYR
jgi:hypothetical protein